MPILLLVALLFAPIAQAQNSAIGVAPTRVVIAPNQQTSEISVINNSDRLMRYKIETVDQTMTSSGTLQSISSTQSFPYSAQSMVKFLPRTVNLSAGGRQTVRLLVTRPQGLPAGDYHTHLLLTEIVTPLPASAISATEPVNETGVNFEVGMSYSMGIPLVVQQGEISSSLTLTSAQKITNPKTQAPELLVTITRSGNAEASAELLSSVTTSSTITPIPATQKRVVRMYREVDTITITLPILEEALKPAASQPITLSLKPLSGPNRIPQTLQIN